jgi:small-conductance mechanosensitive channel
MGLVIVDALPNMFKIALILLFARLTARLGSLLFEAAESGRITLPGVFPETARPTRRIFVAINYLFALVACYPYLPGSGSDAFKGMTVLIGLMISLGGSGVISQAMSGLVLMYTRAHQVGDYVRIGETEGVVTALDMLATKIRTSKREEVTIPNSVVLGTATKNFTRLAGKDGVILHTSVTIGYNAPWRKVHEILIEAANRTAGLKKQPPAFVVQTALSDFYVEYQLNAHLEQPEMRMAVLGKLHSNIQDTFNEAGIAIVSPHYEADPPNPMPPESAA